MRTIVNIFIALIFTGIVVLFAWPIVQKVVKKHKAASVAQTTSSPRSVPETSVPDPATTTATAVPDQPMLDQPPVVNEQVAPPPPPPPTPPPSLLRFLNTEMSEEEMAILKSMNGLRAQNIDEHSSRANNLSPVMMARITMIQRRQDSLLLDVALIKERLSMTHQDSIEFIRDFMKNNPKYFTDKKTKKKK